MKPFWLRHMLLAKVLAALILLFLPVVVAFMHRGSIAKAMWEAGEEMIWVLTHPFPKK